jgi:hypothetical protein
VAVHLLAAALHGSQAVVAQRQVAAKSNETPAVTPLPARLGLRAIVVTAIAMHTLHGHVRTAVAAGGHHVLVVKGNREIPLRDRSRRGHGPRRGPPVDDTHRPARPAVSARCARDGDQAPSRVSRPSRPPLPELADSYSSTGRWKPCPGRVKMLVLPGPASRWDNKLSGPSADDLAAVRSSGLKRTYDSGFLPAFTEHRVLDPPP